MYSVTRCLVASVFMLLLIQGCATSGATHSLEADLRIEQLPDAGFVVEDRGAVSIAFQMSVRNRSANAITLRKVQMQTSARSPYTLRNEPATMSETIEPGKEALVTFTMWSYPREHRSKIRGTVLVSGTAYFDTVNGSSRKAFTQTFREP